VTAGREPIPWADPLSRSADRARIAPWSGLLAQALPPAEVVMRVLVLTIILVLACRVAAPSEAAAQYHRLTDAMVVGGTLTNAGSSTDRLTGGPELGGLIEVPIGDAFRLRGEAAAGFWRFNGYPLDNVPGSRMRRYRFTASLLRSSAPPSPDQRLSGYAGGGAGVYLYRFPERPDGGAWGLHGVAGAEYLLRTMRSRWIVAGEVQLHAMGQPKGPAPGSVVPMLGAHLAMVLKYRLP
jgi:hypothetical protein